MAKFWAHVFFIYIMTNWKIQRNLNQVASTFLCHSVLTTMALLTLMIVIRIMIVMVILRVTNLELQLVYFQLVQEVQEHKFMEHWLKTSKIFSCWKNKIKGWRWTNSKSLKHLLEDRKKVFKIIKVVVMRLFIIKCSCNTKGAFPLQASGGCLWWQLRGCWACSVPPWQVSWSRLEITMPVPVFQGPHLLRYMQLTG